MQQLERRSDRWISAGLSVAVHAALVAALVYGWLSFRKESRPPPSLAIDATVVSSKAVEGSGAISKPITPRAPPHKAPAPPPPPPPQPAVDEPTVPPPPDMAARQEAARKAAQAAEQQAAQAQADAERKVQEAAQRKKQEEAQKVAEERAAEEKAKKLAEAKAAAEAKKRALAAEQQRLAEAKRKAEEQRRAEEAKALAMNPADLQQSVEAEEKAMAARSGPAIASWVDLVRARIQHAWIRPPSAREGIDCIVDVTQVPGGQVVNVKVGACNGDAAVVQSIQDATYRASPLPAPADPSLFERDFQLEFKPMN